MSASPGHPLLLGHRGARISDPRIPENSFAAFDLALNAGCDGFEFDVRCTCDRRLLICHDAEFMRKSVADTDYSDFHSGVCLDDVLARYASTAFLDIELKVVGMHDALVSALRENPPKRGYFVSSFLSDALLEVQSRDARIPLGFICDKNKELERWRTLPIKFLVPHHKLVSLELIEDVHTAGKKLFVWTVNDTRDMLRLAEWDVDALISDDPHLLRTTFL